MTLPEICLIAFGLLWGAVCVVAVWFEDDEACRPRRQKGQDKP